MSTQDSTFFDRFAQAAPAWVKEPYDPAPDITNKVRGGKEYLEVAYRIEWFIREQRRFIAAGLATHPFFIRVNILEHDRENRWIHTETEIQDVFGNYAKDNATQSAKQFADYVEKCGTKSTGRALAKLGYGTTMAQDDESSDLDEQGEMRNLSDAPADRKKSASAPAKPAAKAPAAKAPEKPAAISEELHKRTLAKVNEDRDAAAWMIKQFYPQYNANHRFGQNVTAEDAESFLARYDERHEKYMDEVNKADEEAAAQAFAEPEQPKPAPITPIRPEVQSSDEPVATEEEEIEEAPAEISREEVLSQYAARVADISQVGPEHTKAVARIIKNRVRSWSSEPGKGIRDSFTLEELQKALELVNQYDLKKAPDANILALAPDLVEKVLA